MDESDRFKLYQALLASAAEQLGCEPTAEKAKDLATLRLMRESVTLKLIAGKDCNPADLRWLTEELAKFAPPEPPIKVEIEIVNPTEPDPAPSTPPPSDVGFVSFSQPQLPAPAAPAATAAKPVHPNDLPRRDPGSIHNARLPDGTPARMTGASYGFCAGNVSANPFSAGPRPNFEQSHSLPSPWPIETAADDQPRACAHASKNLRQSPRFIAREQLEIMSALPPKADIAERDHHVRFVPILLQKSLNGER
jgi:hypothetical protein